ncbi:hypothetical protein [Paracoccus sp. AK26]|uniref:hypothetical protein n=1 Tax=Paracoccus sp. AK26 TaxID=2589076 RepID=UPI0014280727|nr:hypothetical protein [Paracoccus sp. AK26]QIR84492.1 hypothetical protein FIU66_04280 [Paracoccus sp. AK26]
MGKFDKDRHQKQIALRYCLAQNYLPCLEVVVNSASDLTSAPEVLTDIDVLGIENVTDGNLRRIVFDCKSSSKLSAIARAFWASGLVSYTGTDGAFVILGKPALFNHRISALKINVDLHDEKSFEELGRTKAQDFDSDTCYQSSIDRWNLVYDAFDKAGWSKELFDLCRNVAPLSTRPEQTFRKILVATRKERGNIDPAKAEHVSIVFDVISYMFILWSRMGRDIRRIYNPNMKREQFEDALRFYVWGGHESFSIRQALFENAIRSGIVAEAAAELQEFPAWKRLVGFAGLVISAPDDIFECALSCRELSIRQVARVDINFDQALRARFKQNDRLAQFISAAISYVTEACRLPKDLEKKMTEEVLSFS